MNDAQRSPRSSSEPSESSDELEPLPPLDDGDDAEGPVEAPLQLRSFGDADAEDTDDSVADDLDIGIRLPDLDGVRAEDDADPPLGGVEELVTAVPENEGADGDASGPADIEPGIGLAELPPLGEASGEGTGESLDGLVAEELPDMDADAEGDAGDADLGQWSDGMDVVDDEPAPAAATAWVWSPLSDVPAPALCATGDALWAGGLAVRSVPLADREPRPVSHVEVSASWVSLAPTDAGLLAVDAVGRVYEWREGAAPCLRDDAAAAVGARRSGGEPVEVLRVRGALLARGAAGDLAQAPTDAVAWKPLPGRRPRALATDGRDAIALIDGPPASVARWSPDAGWCAEPLPASAATWLRDRAALVAARGPVIALASRSRGVCVRWTSDGDLTPLPGTVGAVALTLSASGPTDLYVAVHRDATGAIEIVRYAEGGRSGERIVEVPGGGDDGAAVSALHFDVATRRLWVAGDLGLAYATPPEGSQP